MKTNNQGFLIQNNDSLKDAFGCIVVVGLARSGTSAVASSLAALGVYMGDKAEQPLFEDRKIISTIPSRVKSLLGVRVWDDFSNIAQEYTHNYGLWGFKYPSIHNHLFRVNKILNKPRYIFVYRDICTISSRRSDIFSSISHLDSMKNCLQIYGKTLGFIERERPLSLHVSYEKMLTNTEGYVEAVSDFCCISPSEDILNAVKSSIMPSPDVYQDWSEKHKQALLAINNGYIGHLGIVNQKIINGWASNLKETYPVTVEVFVNGVLHGQAIADKDRPDVKESGNTKTSIVGFEYSFKNNQPSTDDVLKVFIAGTNIEIINSGKQIGKY